MFLQASWKELRGNGLSRILEFSVPKEFDGKKLSAFIRGYAGLSYSLYATLRHTEGSVQRDEKLIRSIDRVFEGDVITVTLPDRETEIIPTPMELDIIYEDDDLLVLNKSGFTAVHPSHGHREDTLANGVVHYLLSKGRSAAFRAVGRLDKGTSGVVVCALNTYSASKLSGNVEKTYIAISDGIVEGEGTVDVPIVRPDPDKTLRACSEEGESAVTHYRVLANGNEKSLLSLTLETGRTHQIRVHMAHIGAPLTGDSLYGDENGHGRHMLHCYRCRMIHPVRGNEMVFEAPFPAEFLSEIEDNFGNNVRFD